MATVEQVIRQAALRCNAIIAATALAGARETAYATSPITSTQLNSPDFPWTSWKDGFIGIEEKLSRRIANNPYCSYRSNITSQTATLANLASLPGVDASGNKIIGEWGDVKDSSDGGICTLKPLARIARILRLPLKGNYYYFNLISGQRITHTRTSVVGDVCTYNSTARRTAINTVTSSVLLADALEEAYVCGLTSHDGE
jgi:hypothetical protein